MARRQKSDYDGAIADATKAVSIWPKYAGAYFARGMAHDGKGDWQAALEDLSKSITLDPPLQSKAQPWIDLAQKSLTR
jgi:tetratricopeptide (TPR) repeat protein